MSAEFESHDRWIALYPDQAEGITETGIGSDIFSTTETPEDMPNFVNVMPTAHASACLIKSVNGMQRVGSHEVKTENGRSYHVPNYKRWDTVVCVAVDTQKMEENGIAKLFETSSIFSFPTYALKTKTPFIEPKYIIGLKPLMLSDKQIPTIP